MVCPIFGRNVGTLFLPKILYLGCHDIIQEIYKCHYYSTYQKGCSLSICYRVASIMVRHVADVYLWNQKKMKVTCVYLEVVNVYLKLTPKQK